MKDGPLKRAYLQIGGATGCAPFEKVWELLKHTVYNKKPKYLNIQLFCKFQNSPIFVCIHIYPRVILFTSNFRLKFLPVPKFENSVLQKIELIEYAAIS